MTDPIALTRAELEAELMRLHERMHAEGFNGPTTLAQLQAVQQLQALGVELQLL
jgi:hypothetical protein